MAGEIKEGAIVMFSDDGGSREMRVTRVRRTGPNTTDLTLEVASGPNELHMHVPVHVRGGPLDRARHEPYLRDARREPGEARAMDRGAAEGGGVSMAEMSDEEYLRARGWNCNGSAMYRWEHPNRPDPERGGLRCYALAEAVKAQLAEDRALYNFVRARSAVEGGMLVPKPAEPPPAPPGDSLWFEDRGDDQPTPYLYIGDRGEWYAFRMTPGKARAWAKALTDFAEGRPVAARPAGEERGYGPEFYERKEPSR